MSIIQRSGYLAWHQSDILREIISELERPETNHFIYTFRHTKMSNYSINLRNAERVSIGLAYQLAGISELEGKYHTDDDDEQKGIKSLRYILASAYYRLCCQLVGTPCMKEDQHKKSLVFAITKAQLDIYEHLVQLEVKRKVKRDYRLKRKKESMKVNRFQLMDFDD